MPIIRIQDTKSPREIVIANYHDIMDKMIRFIVDIPISFSFHFI